MTFPKASAKGSRPVVFYDDACGFCCASMRAWRRRVGERVEFRPSFEGEACSVGKRSPGAVRIVDGEGRIHRGAEAVFLLTSLWGSPAGALFIRLYRWLPPFRWVSDLIYATIARNRRHVSRILGLSPEREQ